jgi:hypothetical protein
LRTSIEEVSTSIETPEPEEELGFNPTPNPDQPLSNSQLAGASGSNSAFSKLLDLIKTLAEKQRLSKLAMAKTDTDMPLPGTRDAPGSRGEIKASNLRRFLEAAETLFKNCKITDEQEKKKWLGRYADELTEEAWESLDTYDPPATYEAHKEAILDSYWGTKNKDQGSVRRLNDLIRDFRGLKETDQEDVYTFLRSFRMIMKKLLKDKLVTNRELVDKFMEGLSPTFKSAVEFRLEGTRVLNERIKALENAAQQGQAAVAGQPPAAQPQPKAKMKVEDLYEIEEVMAIVKEMATRRLDSGSEEISRANRHRSSTPVVKQEEVDLQLEGLTAALKDHMVLQEKREKSNRDEFKAWTQEMMKAQAQALSQVNHSQSYRSNDNYNRSYNANSGNSGNDGNSGNCFYCGESGHRSDECSHRQKHLRDGWIVLDGKGFKLPGGNWLPRLPAGVTKTPKERVEDFHRKESSNVYETYEFLRGDLPQDNQFGSYQILQKPKVEEPKKLVDSTLLERFQEFETFMKTRGREYRPDQDEGESSSRPSF